MFLLLTRYHYWSDNIICIYIYILRMNIYIMYIIYVKTCKNVCVYVLYLVVMCLLYPFMHCYVLIYQDLSINYCQ